MGQFAQDVPVVFVVGAMAHGKVREGNIVNHIDLNQLIYHYRFLLIIQSKRLQSVNIHYLLPSLAPRYAQHLKRHGAYTSHSEVNNTTRCTVLVSK